MRKSKVRSACRYLITGNAVLEGPYEPPICACRCSGCKGWEVTVQVAPRALGPGAVRQGPATAHELLALCVGWNCWRCSKAQWIAPGATVEGREQDFRDAHRSGDPLLIYNDGQQPPQRVDPPAFPAAVPARGATQRAGHEGRYGPV